MADLAVNPASRASAEFDITRPLRLSRSATTLNPLDGTPIAYIYSRAVDGINDIRIGHVSIANVCGLSEEQERALVDRIADELVAPAFSEEEIEDIAFELMDIDDVHDTICDHHRERARELANNITMRRRLNLSGTR